jgi:hypothetical protein
LTAEQRTAFREACAKSAKEKHSVGVVTGTQVSDVAMIDVSTVKTQVPDVEMVDAGVARITAGVAYLGYGGNTPASRKLVCVKVNATQRAPTSHQVTYVAETKGGSAKGIKAITQMEIESSDEG